MDWETGVRFPVCAEIFVFAHAVETAVEPTQLSMQWVQRAVPSTENWLILKADDTTDEDCLGLYFCFPMLNAFAASYLNTQGLNNSYLKSPASTLVDLTFQSRALRSFSLNQLRNLSL